MSDQPYRKLWSDGLWSNNVVLVQGLALCPTVAVTTSATNGLGLGILTLVALLACNLAISATRKLIPDNVRIPAFILLIATVVTILDQALNAWGHALHQVLGLFVPLIVTNCAILGRAEAAARRMPLLPAAVDALAMGLGFTAVLLFIGGARELLGSGTLFGDAANLFGPLGEYLAWRPMADQGLLIARLPAGGFMALGLMLALRRLLVRVSQAQQAKASGCVTGGAA